MIRTVRVTRLAACSLLLTPSRLLDIAFVCLFQCHRRMLELRTFLDIRPSISAAIGYGKSWSTSGGGGGVGENDAGGTTAPDRVALRAWVLRWPCVQAHLGPPLRLNFVEQQFFGFCLV